LYDDNRLSGKFLHLLRCLYGADSAPRQFHDLLHNWFIADGFSVNAHEPCLYIKWVNGVPIFALTHVDDITIVSTDALIHDMMIRVEKVFAIKRLGALGLNADGSPSLLLGMEVRRMPDEFQIRQTRLIDELVEKAGNELNSIPHEKVPIRDIRLDTSSSPTTPAERAKWRLKRYRSFLGVVGYLCLASRNECPYAYKELSRFNENYGQDHWDALMRLVAYLRKTRDTHYLSISKFGGFVLSAYCDSDWNGSNTCLSTTGWIVFLGHTPITWCSRMQRCTARSTGEAEFIALSSVSQECVYLRMFVLSLGIEHSTLSIHCNDRSRYEADGVSQGISRFRFRTAVDIWSDSQVALTQAAKPENWIVDKLRHIRTAYFFFKSYIRSGSLVLHPCSGVDNPSDIYTKGFGAPGKTALNQKAEYFQRHAEFVAGRRQLALSQPASTSAVLMLGMM
jgi:hypothetical protein